MCKRDNFNILICSCYVYLKWNERVISDVNPASEPLQKMPKLNTIANKNFSLVNFFSFREYVDVDVKC